MRLHALRTAFVLSMHFFLLSLLTPHLVSAYALEEAYEPIQKAEEAVFSAFENVLEAENAGANVSRLVARLNKAGDLLVEARVSLKGDDPGEAMRLANRSVEIANGVEDDALGLLVSALADRDLAFKVSLVGSSIGVPAFLFLMFLLWRRFKGYYARKLLSLRPEVAEDAEA